MSRTGVAQGWLHLHTHIGGRGCPLSCFPARWPFYLPWASLNVHSGSDFLPLLLLLSIPLHMVYSCLWPPLQLPHYLCFPLPFLCCNLICLIICGIHNYIPYYVSHIANNQITYRITGNFRIVLFTKISKILIGFRIFVFEFRYGTFGVFQVS